MYKTKGNLAPCLSSNDASWSEQYDHTLLTSLKISIAQQQKEHKVKKYFMNYDLFATPVRGKWE